MRSLNYNVNWSQKSILWKCSDWNNLYGVELMSDAFDDSLRHTPMDRIIAITKHAINPLILVDQLSFVADDI